MDRKKFGKRLAIGLVGLATLTGTFYNNEGGFPPIYTRKTGTTGGVCVSLYTKVEHGATFYGPVISLARRIDGTVNGADISLLGLPCDGTVNGLEASVLGLNTHIPTKEFNEIKGMKVNGVGVYAFGLNEQVYGLNLGVSPFTKRLVGIQIGLIGITDIGITDEIVHCGGILVLPNGEEKTTSQPAATSQKSSD